MAAGNSHIKILHYTGSERAVTLHSTALDNSFKSAAHGRLHVQVITVILYSLSLSYSIINGLSNVSPPARPGLFFGSLFFYNVS